MVATSLKIPTIEEMQLLEETAGRDESEEVPKNEEDICESE